MVNVLTNDVTAARYASGYVNPVQITLYQRVCIEKLCFFTKHGLHWKRSHRLQTLPVPANHRQRSIRIRIRARRPHLDRGAPLGGRTDQQLRQPVLNR